MRTESIGTSGVSATVFTEMTPPNRLLKESKPSSASLVYPSLLMNLQMNFPENKMNCIKKKSHTLLILTVFEEFKNVFVLNRIRFSFIDLSNCFTLKAIFHVSKLSASGPGLEWHSRNKARKAVKSVMLSAPPTPYLHTDAMKYLPWVYALTLFPLYLKKL